MDERKCIVAIGAHAADMEFTAGATLLKHARSGWEAHIVHLTLGEKGNPKLSPEEYGAQKRREAESAAKILQATPHFLPYSDGELTVSDDIAREIAELLRQLQPQVVITHWRESIHSDHIATHYLTKRAIFMAVNPHFDLEGLPPVKGVRLYYAENWEDHQNFQPFVYVDISDVFADWERAFKCFAIGRGEGGFPYWDWYQAQTRIRGIEIGTMYAQAFAVDGWRVRQRVNLL
ncbi:MAG: PIG-L deacetylase family protein [Armatimonadota bacterium]